MNQYISILGNNLGAFEANNPENGTLADETDAASLFNASRPPKMTCRYCGKPVEPEPLYDRDGQFVAWMPYGVCEEHKELQERDEQERRERNEREKRKRDWTNYEAAMKSAVGGIGFCRPDWQESTLDAYKPQTPMQKLALKACRKYVAEFSRHLGSSNGERPGDGRGLYLYGDNGRGKTHLLKAIGIALMQSGYYGVVYRTDQAIIDDIGAARSRRDDSERDCIEVFGNCNLLIIDDFGKETPSGYAVFG